MKDQKVEFSIHIGGGNGWWRAHCPEMNTSGSGETVESAVESLFECMRMASKYITAEIRDDPRLLHAERVMENWSNLKALFPNLEEEKQRAQKTA